MATHDYVIANGTGAAVRSDLNGALAAIVSQNSSASAPATMYAYMLWADTTAGIMKMRNGANSAWISLWELDGTFIATDISLSAGTAGAPSLYFTGDTNTGIYSPGADQVAISTGGTGRLFVSSAGLVGVGTSSPSSVYRTTINGDGSSIVGGLILRNNGTDTLTIGNVAAANDVDSEIWNPRNGYLRFATNNTERLRITAGGLVGIGTSAPQEILEVRKDSAGASVVGALFSNVSSSANTAVGISFSPNSSGTARAASIYGVNETAAANATALTFHTNANGASQTEKARITSSGQLLVGTSSGRSNLYTGALSAALQVEGTTYSTSALSIIANGSSSAQNPYSFLYLGRSRGATVGSNTVVQSGDEVGAVVFTGADGTNLIPTASIESYVDGTPGAGDMPGRLVFSTTADGAASPTERMRIANNGVIQARNAAGDTLNLYNAVSAGSSNAFIYGLHSSASVYAGTTSFIVYTNGNVVNTNGSYTTISDAKLKENIVDAGSQWDDFKAIQIRNWNFKAETGHETHRQIGPIAQELETVCPGLVFETPDRGEDGNETGEVTKGVNQSVLYMKAVKALQEAMERIEQLEASNTDLLARVTALESA